jgi:hypothetical protein
MHFVEEPDQPASPAAAPERALAAMPPRRREA